MRRLAHRYWTGRAHPLDRFNAMSIASNNSGQVMDWFDDSLPAELCEEIRLAEGKVRDEDAIRHRCNVVRWWLLYNYGGFTIHHDVVLLESLEYLPFPMTAAHAPGLRCTSFMGFPKGHEVPQRALDEIRQAPLSSKASSPWVSGERLLDRLVCDLEVKPVELVYPLNSSGERVPGISPWAVFLRFPKERYRPNVGVSNGS